MKITPRQFALLLIGCLFFLSTLAAFAQDIKPAIQPTKSDKKWSDKPVTLRIKPVMENNQFRAIDVSYTFVAPNVSALVLRLPDEWGGERALYQALTDLQVIGASVTATKLPNVYQLTLKPHAEVTVRYRVMHEAKTSRKQFGNDYRPQILPHYFHLIGDAIVPEIETMWAGSPARFILEGMPAHLSFASDLEHQQMGRQLTVADLTESVLVGGDFRVLDAGHGARLAIRGAWTRPDDEWQKQFSRIAAAQRDFWGTKSEPFLVTIIDLPIASPGATSVGGTGRSDAFAFFATPNASVARIDQVMAHEMMHSWIPRKIGSLPDSNEQLTYWLSEGFTDWASWRAMVRGGIFNIENFVSAFNESLKNIQISSARNATNQAIMDGFWTNPAVQSLPYQRGMLMASYWDYRVRQATEGRHHFETVLLEMARLAALDPNAVGLSVQYLQRAMKTIANIDITSDIKKYIDEGHDAPLIEDMFAPCGTLQTLKRRVFHRGFDVQASLKANNVIKGVVVDGPAYKAGLRDEMKLVGRTAGEIGDSRVEIAYEVMDGEIKKTLRWLPEGKEMEAVATFMLNKNFSADERAACEKRLGRAS
jgi:predicted metalloprotease with PDZ domain